MCIFCGSRSHVPAGASAAKRVSPVPGLGVDRRGLMTGAAALGGLYASSKVLAPRKARAQGAAAGRADFVIGV